MEGARGRPWKWHRLAHVCWKWRQVISMSPRRLGLRILCGHGAPIEGILGTWPTLPLVVEFHHDASQGSKPMPKDIILALHHPDRLSKIDLQVTSSMTGPIVETMRRPCLALESIRIKVTDTMGPSILVRSSFLGGSAPHLKVVELNGLSFPFPEIRRALLSTDLVELRLLKIPNAVYFSPDDFVTTLSTLNRLELLMLGFHSPASSPPSCTTLPPLKRITLRHLKFFKFHGASEYLEEFVARIDLPALRTVIINLFNQVFFEIPQISRFICGLPVFTPESPAWVSVTHSAESVRFYLAQDSDARVYCLLTTSCRQLDWQMFFVTQISSQLSPLLSSVHLLTIQKGDGFPTGEDVDSTQWLELFQPFTHVTKLRVFGQLVPGVIQALANEEMAPGLVFPELTSLHLEGYRDFPSNSGESC